VRGGNLTKTWYCVNGIEIYRPFLVTTAQQEGLSFVNRPGEQGGILDDWQPATTTSCLRC
jgi:hypothetical protein